MSTFQVGSRLFAITDNQDVFALEITENAEIPSGSSEQALRRLRTKIADLDQFPAYKRSYIQAAHTTYFSKVYLRDGQLEMTGAVYATEVEAIQRVIVLLDEKKKIAQRELDSIARQQDQLTKDLAVALAKNDR